MAVEDSVDYVPQLEVISRKISYGSFDRGECQRLQGGVRVYKVRSPRKFLALRKACLHERDGGRSVRREGGRQAGSSKELWCGGPLARSLAIVVEQENLFV